MSNIKIGRYAVVETDGEWTGFVEPEDRSWIIFLNHEGKPGLYWSQRDPDGGVVGDPLTL